MLDILGNVFGRGKKDKNNGTSGPAASTAGEAGSSDGFAVVGHDRNGQVPFIYPTMLTNEMLRPSPAAAAPASATSSNAFAASPSSSAASSSNRTPFSSDPASFVPVTQNTNTWNSHADNLTLLRNMNGINQISAMDQVPFVPHAAYADPSRATAADPKDEMRRCYATIDRVSGLLAASSQSEYNFEVERGVIRETSASSWQMFT